MAMIDGLNEIYQERGMVFKENSFADMTEKEFAATHLFPRRSPATFESASSHQTSQKLRYLPTSFDWKGKGVVTAVKDQGSAGTCWAFSAVQNIEGQWAKLGKPLTELSVEQVVDCDGTKDAEKEKADCGVFGGWPYLAYQYVQKAGGIQTETDYPYCCGLGGGEGTCFVCPAPGYNKTLCGPPSEYCKISDSCSAKINPSKFVAGLKVSGWQWFGQNETDIAINLLNIGPLSVAMNAGMLQFYHSGIYDPLFCDPKSLDHAVLITGYGEEKTILGEMKKYWTVKNSWGKKWGEDGYFRIARDKNKCGIATQVTTVELEII
uniref:procathepsin L-like n=1 Tax=Styela clava TaxID=7725 RepID=UPI00193A4A5F|nr:procathepsin L-like [Styela clava]